MLLLDLFLDVGALDVLLAAAHRRRGPDQRLINVGDHGHPLLVGGGVLQVLQFEAHVAAAVARLEGHLELDLLARVVLALEHLAAERDRFLEVELRHGRGDLGLDDFDFVRRLVGGPREVQTGGKLPAKCVVVGVFVDGQPLLELVQFGLKFIIPSLDLLHLARPLTHPSVRCPECAHLALKNPDLVIQLCILRLQLPNHIIRGKSLLIAEQTVGWILRWRAHRYPLRQFDKLLVD